MHKRKLAGLRNELAQAGADNTEIAPLLRIAARLDHLHPTSREPASRGLSRYWPRLALAGLTGMLCLALGMGLVIFSQTSLPGSRLYPVKRLSEQAAVLVQPDYRASIMMHRAQEVQALVANHASSQTILATLTAYQTDAAAYRSDAANYSAFEYCKSSLEQAETKANPQDRQAISITLASLEDV